MFKWKLRACRVQAGLYQREAAKALGISEVSLVNYEKGKSSLTVEELLRHLSKGGGNSVVIGIK